MWNMKLSPHWCFLIQLVTVLRPSRSRSNYCQYCSKIANKTEEKYEKVQTMIRCKSSFLILRSVLLCIRGIHSISKNAVVLNDVSDVFCSRLILYIGISLLGVSYLKVKYLFFILSKFILPLYTGLVDFSSICLQLVSCHFLIFCYFGTSMLVKSQSILTVYMYMVI